MCSGESGSLGIVLMMASWITGEPFVLTMFCFALCYGGPTWILLLVLELDCYLGGSNAFLGLPMNLCHDETGTQSVCVGSLQALHSLLHPTSSLGLQQRIFITYQRVSPCTCNECIVLNQRPAMNSLPHKFQQAGPHACVFFLRTLRCSSFNNLCYRSQESAHRAGCAAVPTLTSWLSRPSRTKSYTACSSVSESCCMCLSSFLIILVGERVSSQLTYHS